MKKYLLVLAVLGLISPDAKTENIGNNEMDLAVKSILKADDGLSVEEKLYKLWQEAEGSLPDLPVAKENSKPSYICLRGMGISKTNRYDESLLVMVQTPEKTAMVDENLLGKVVLKKAASFGLIDVAHDEFTRFGSYAHSPSCRISADGDLLDRLLLVPENGGIGLLPFKYFSDSRTSDEGDILDFNNRVILRKISPGLVIGVLFQTEKNGFSGFCRDTWAIATEPSKAIVDKRNVQTGWQAPDLKVPGICSIFVFKTAANP